MGVLGICGAALYLSTLMLEKPRSLDDFGKILKISPDTIKKRVDGTASQDHIHLPISANSTMTMTVDCLTSPIRARP
jgi:transcription initiation factor TFIIIB Brf1 subunit/transcription initiation factor TFIIB